MEEKNKKEKTEKKKVSSKPAKKAGEKTEKTKEKKQETKPEQEKKPGKQEIKALEKTEKKPKEKPATENTVAKAGEPERKWIELKPVEVEEAIISLANAGHTTSEIGMILRDQYGVPKAKAITGKNITDILKRHNLLGEVPEDMLNLIRKSVRLKEHLKKNRKDMSAKRGYQLTISKIRRLAKYYTEKNRLPKAWRFSEEQAELLVK